MNMTYFVCRTNSGALEIIRSNSKPANALCETPVDPDTGAQVPVFDYLDINYFYYVPESDTRVDTTENGVIPQYYKNFATDTWHTPIPDPLKTYWKDNGVWKDAVVNPPPPEATVHTSNPRTPQRMTEAVINAGNKTSYLTAQIAPIKSTKKANIKRQYDAKISVITSLYPQSERDAWDKKEDEARVWLTLSAGDKTAAVADNTAYPLLYEEALQGVYNGTSAQKVTAITDVATRVSSNALAYKVYSGKCTGLLKAALAAIDAMTGTYAEVKASLDAYTVSWPQLD